MRRFKRSRRNLKDARLAAENFLVEQEIRQFNFGKRVGTYRALFTIMDDEVRILHIRRAAMGTAQSEDIQR